MKKALSFLLVLLLLICIAAFASCSGDDNNETPPTTDNGGTTDSPSTENNGSSNSSNDDTIKENDEKTVCEEHNYTDNVCSKCGCSLWSGNVDTSWYSVVELEFNISTAEQLAGLSELTNSGVDFHDTTINLLSDIDFAGKEWSPIGTRNTQFAGIFEGNNHIVSNYIINQSYDFSGLFGAFSGTINNLTVNNFEIYINLNNLSNVAFNSVFAGGIVGGSQGGYINGCGGIGDIRIEGITDDDSISVSVGGVCGTSGEQVSNCFADVDILCIDCGDNIGGLIGYSSTTLVDKSYSISNIVCQTTGDFAEPGNYEKISVGGLIGGLGNPGVKAAVNDCFSKGEISVTANKSCYLGGLVGCIRYGSTISNSYSTTNIQGQSSYVRNCFSYAGGLVGGQAEFVAIDRIDVKNCWTSNSVKLTTNYGEAYVGYICGDYLFFENCFYSNESKLSGNNVTHQNLTPVKTDDFKNVFFYENRLLWDDEVWNYESGEFPTLRKKESSH